MTRENPFLALRSYTRAQAARFFGRDSDLVVMKSRLLSGRSILLFAASGTGKTSFLDARLRPAVEADCIVIPQRAWASAPPLVAARSATKAALTTAGLKADDVPIPEMLRLAAQGNESTRFLFILDQFEEVFQYWRDVQAIDDFAAEIAAITQNALLDARVLFSMREEFLGELGLFDQLIPDLFGNSYRLKNPSREQCEDIIERTAGRTSEVGLERLLDDLTSCASGGQSHELSVWRKRIALPFLQIVCHRIWQAEMTSAPAGAVFLENYETGRAERELRSYCTETLTRLLTTDTERDIASEAFGYLMTRRGTKMAYELDNLAAHMKRPKAELDAVLKKLAADDVRILHGFQGGTSESQWYELYHDLYAVFLFEWKTEQDRVRRAREEARRYNEIRAEIEEHARKIARRRRAIQAFALAFGIVLLLAAVGWRQYRNYQTVRHLVLDGRGSYGDAVAAASSLIDGPWFHPRVQRLWAVYWKNQAIKSALVEDREEAIVAAMMSLSIDSDPQLLRELTTWTSGSIQSIQARAVLPSRASGLEIETDGKTALTLAGGRVYRWFLESGQLTPLGQLRFRAPSSPANEHGGPADTSEGAPELTSALAFSRDGKHVVAYGRNRFGLFSTNGESLWFSESAERSRGLAAFSPDGTLIAIAASKQVSSPLAPMAVQLCTMTSASPSCTDLPDLTTRSRPVFSADSREVAIVEAKSPPRVTFWNVVGRTPTMDPVSPAAAVVYLSQDRIAVRRNFDTVQILERRGRRWAEGRTLPIHGTFSYVPELNLFAVDDRPTQSIHLIDVRGAAVAKVRTNQMVLSYRVTPDKRLVTVSPSSHVTLWSFGGDNATANEVRIPPGETLAGVNSDGTAFITAKENGLYWYDLQNRSTGRRFGADLDEQVSFNPSGTRFVVPADQHLAIFDAKSLQETARVPLTAGYSDAVWLSDERLRVVNAETNQCKVVDAVAGRELPELFDGQDLQLSPAGDMIVTEGNLRIRRAGRTDWLVFRDSEGIESFHVRRGKVAGIRGNQLRIWDLAAPAAAPVVVKTDDKLAHAEVAFLSDYYITVSEAGDFNLWAIKDPSKPVFAVRVESNVEIHELPSSQGAAVLLAGSQWIHVLRRIGADRFEIVSRAFDGTLQPDSLRVTRAGIRLAIERGSTVFVSPVLKTDLSDVAPMAPSPGQSWTDVQNAWKRRLNLEIDQGKVVTPAIRN